MFGNIEDFGYLCTRKTNMVPVVQLVRASDCGSECRRFESVRAPQKETSPKGNVFFCEKGWRHPPEKVLHVVYSQDFCLFQTDHPYLTQP